MAKRFTDTEKWKDDWYLSLSNDYRIIWQWLLDNCNHAGICKPSINLLNMMCNTKISEDELIEKMNGRILKINNIWFVPKFLKFQYGSLNSKKPAVLSVINELKINNLLDYVSELFNNSYETITEPLDNDSETIKDKDTLKDKEINKENNKKEILQNSNLFRQPNIPTKESVLQFFLGAGGTKEMAKSFYEKYDAVGWFSNNSPIVNYTHLANRFITNWKSIEDGKKQRTNDIDPTKVKIVLK